MNGLLSNPVISGLLGAGPNAIRMAAEQQRAALAPRGGGGMSGAPGAIVTQDRSAADLGQGLAGLGQGLAAIGQMRERAAQKEAIGKMLEGLPEDQRALAEAFPQQFAVGRIEAMNRAAKPGEYVNIFNPTTKETRVVQKGAPVPAGFALAGPIDTKDSAPKRRNVVNPRTNEYRTIAETDAMPQGFVLAGEYSPPTPRDDKGAFGSGTDGQALDIYTRVGLIPEDQRSPLQRSQFLAAQWRLSQPRVIPGQDGSLYAVNPTSLPNVGSTGGQPLPAPAPGVPQAPGTPVAAPGDPAAAPAQPGAVPGVPTASASGPAPGQTVTTLKAPDKRDDRVTPTETTKGLELRTQIQSAEQGIANLRRALELNGQAYSGPTADLLRKGARLTGLDPEGLAATTEFENIVLNNVLAQLKATFGGNPTEGERAILQQVSGSIGMSRGERAAVLNNAISILNRKIDATRSNLDALGAGAVTEQPNAQKPSDFSTMSLEEIIKVDPLNMSEPEAKAYIDRLRALGVPVGN